MLANTTVEILSRGCLWSVVNKYGHHNIRLYHGDSTICDVAAPVAKCIAETSADGEGDTAANPFYGKNKRGKRKRRPTTVAEKPELFFVPRQWGFQDSVDALYDKVWHVFVAPL